MHYGHLFVNNIEADSEVLLTTAVANLPLLPTTPPVFAAWGKGNVASFESTYGRLLKAAIEMQLGTHNRDSLSPRFTDSFWKGKGHTRNSVFEKFTVQVYITLQVVQYYTVCSKENNGFHPVIVKSCCFL